MIPNIKGLLLDNINNYGILKTEGVFDFQSRNPTDFLNVGYDLSTHTEPLEWILTHVKLEKRAFDGLPYITTNNHEGKQTKTPKSLKRKRKWTGKGKKCVVKLTDKDKRMRRRRKNRSKMTKIVMPLLLGLMAAKSILVPVALKTIAFISAKGFLMGFFSTILASILSLKGMFDNSYRNQDRKDEKTQVEIIQVPAQKEEHYYDEDPYYRREDLVSLVPISGTLVNP